MPYTFKKENNKWLKINNETGRVTSTHDTLKKAKDSVKARHAQLRKKQVFLKRANNLLKSN